MTPWVGAKDIKDIENGNYLAEEVDGNVGEAAEG